MRNSTTKTVVAVIPVILLFMSFSYFRNTESKPRNANSKHLDKIVIDDVDWYNKGAIATCGDKTYNYAAMIDPKHIENAHFFKGTECALQFRAQTRSDINWVEISDITVDVLSYEPLKNCSLKVPAPAMVKSVFYVEIHAPLDGQQSFSANRYIENGVVNNFKGWKIENGKPEKLMVRINATDEGLYLLRVKIKTRSSDNEPFREMQIGKDEKFYFRR